MNGRSGPRCGEAPNPADAGREKRIASRPGGLLIGLCDRVSTLAIKLLLEERRIWSVVTAERGLLANVP
jgi:hypothetical protein